jgi:hypothetical protein
MKKELGETPLSYLSPHKNPSASTQNFKDGLAIYKKGGYEKAVREFLKAARQGHDKAVYNLGCMFARGIGVRQDYNKSAKLFRMAARQGHTGAVYNLGCMFARGIGVPQDYIRSAKLFHVAAEQGHTGAQYNLGIMYARGKGVPRDLIQALMWLNLVVGLGHEKAKKAQELIAKRMTSTQIAEANTLVEKRFNEHNK